MIKLVFFFNQGRQGFSETYYVPGDNPLQVAQLVSNQLLTAITTFRTFLTQLWAIRATLQEDPKTSYLRLIRGTYNGGIPTTEDGQADVVSTTAVYKITGQSSHTRRLFFRGLPDVFVKRDTFGNDVLPTGLRDAVNNFLGLAKSALWSVRYAKKWGEVGVTRVNIIEVDTYPGRPDWSILKTDAVLPAGFTKGARVIFHGAPKAMLPYFPRSAELLYVDSLPNSLLTIPYRLPGGILVKPPSMTAVNRVYGYDIFNNYEFERFSRHSTGRPFGALRGSQSAVSR